MSGKLAFRNAKRSARDYRIYVMTVSIAFALIYSFNLIIFSEDIMELNQMMDRFIYILVFVSVIVVFVIGWLVSYMARFMLVRRSKEFGTYMTLGISNRAVAGLFCIENVLMGGVSLVLGILLGTLLYQVLVFIIMHIFEAVYEVKIQFSVEAFALTVLYAGLIYFYSMLRLTRRIRKARIYDLLYADRQNETPAFGKRRIEMPLFFIALVFGAAGAVLCQQTFENGNNVQPGPMGAFVLCFILCIYSFYAGISRLLVRIFVEKKNEKFANSNFVVIRSLAAKIRTMSMTLGTLAMLLTFTLALTQMSTLFKEFFDMQAANVCPFEIMITEPPESDFQNYKEYIHEQIGCTWEKSYPLYDSGANPVGERLDGTQVEMTWYGNDTVLAFRDYARLREMLGYPEVELAEDEFLVHGIAGVKQELGKEKNLTVIIGGRKLQCKGIMDEAFALDGIHGAYFVLVVPDKAAEGLEKDKMIYAAETDQKTTVQDYEGLCRYIKPVEDDEGNDFLPLGNVHIKGNMLSEIRTAFTIMAFSFLYIGLIFICTALTILSVQQLSEAGKHRQYYRIMSRLGMNREKTDQMIRKQILIYFGLPLILPVVLSLLCTLSMYQILATYVGIAVLVKTIAGAFFLFFFIYALYVAATYVNYRNSVLD